ncbi:MAG: TAT-variant-translocated molybdopterin oxidoreductase [Saprospiraceae bacterium]|nr:TAT-variant-translocated molybdopterin oxidoreductase [Saprospiraceae bacterium]
MKGQNQDVWVGADQLNGDETYIENAKQEFVSLPIVDSLAKEDSLTRYSTNRRDFLKYLGFGLGAATVAAGCEIPVKRAIPYVVKPDTIVPGVASYYASTFVNGGECCPVLVKTREGRPIKIEGNSLSSMTGGGTSARAQASVLSLYDTNRIQGPGKIEGGTVVKGTWAELDQAVSEVLTPESNIRVVTNTNISPTSKKAMDAFVAAFPNTKVVTYDAVSASAMLEANERDFGMAVVPDYHFDKADYIVSFDADFLGTWISPVEFSRDYAENRKIKSIQHAKMSRHVQVEAGMSMTGSNSDNRILVKPSEQGAAIAALYNALSGSAAISAPGVNDKAAAAINKVANDLMKHKGHALVVSGSNNVAEQCLVNAINNTIGAYGNTITFANYSFQRQGRDKDIQDLITEMNSGGVDALFLLGTANPAFDLPNGSAFADAASKVATRIAMGGSLNETSVGFNWAAPANHILESWGDAQAKVNEITLIQPTIAPLFDTRQAECTLLMWAGSDELDQSSDQPYYDYLKANWQATAFANQSDYASFQSFWNSALHDGVISTGATIAEPTYAGSTSDLASGITQPSNSGLEVNFYESINVGGGEYADNPWLQELPNPVTRTTWGNYIAVPVSFDGQNSFDGFNGLKDGDLVDLTVNGQTRTFPVIQQFGQMENTVSVAIGYGRKDCGPGGQDVGTNVQDLIGLNDGNRQYFASGASLGESKGQEDHFSCVQYHHTMGVTAENNEGKEINADEAAIVQESIFGKMGVTGYQGSLTERTIIRKTHVNDIEQFVEDLHHEREHHQHLNEQSIYAGFDDDYKQGHHWGMYVDLNACTGCGSCSVACMAENNVPVVGKVEVARHHEMSWLRIDRYYYGDVENPNVVYQPLMCQHCDNAPCENVCPVAATNHSSEGLNQMTYNRCVGTRYCANNCPFKVRRFNWYDYTTADLMGGNEYELNKEGDEKTFYADNLTRMVLNPDVTVRSRGVIEKCSFCVQRIQEGKLTAKREGRSLIDADVKTACQTACPTGAITFGDMNNKEGILAQKFNSPLNYILLEEINVRASVQYSAKVNNRDEALNA